MENETQIQKYNRFYIRLAIFRNRADSLANELGYFPWNFTIPKIDGHAA